MTAAGSVAGVEVGITPGTPSDAEGGRLFALLSPCGWGNLGDAAIQDAMIHHLRRDFESARIYAFTQNPADTERRHGVPAFRLSGHAHRWYSIGSAPVETGGAGEAAPPPRTARSRLKQVLGWVPGALPALRLLRRAAAPVLDESRHFAQAYRLLRRCDAVFVSGGGQLDDLYGGGWGHPYVLFKWALLARALDVDFVFLSVGAGTLGSPLSRFFARHALSMASYRSYRDATTKGMLVSLGVGANDPIVPDLAYSYPRPNPPVPRRHRAGSPAVVGLSPMVYSHPKIWPRRDPTRYERYLGQLRSFLIWLLQQGHQVVLFASDAQDELAIQDLKARLGQGEWPGTCTHRKVESVASLFELLESCDAVVASRLHGVLLAHLAERPTLAISYEFKVSRLMEDMGLKDYCLEIDEFTSADAVERFQALEANADAVVRAIRQATAPYAARLEVQYQEVFSAIRRRRAKRQPALGAAS